MNVRSRLNGVKLPPNFSADRVCSITNVCGYTTQGNTVDLEEILNRLVVTRAVPRIDYQTATIARSVEITIVWQATPGSKKTQQLAWLGKKVAPSKVNNATFRSHGYNGIFRITHIASHCTGKTIVSRPIARIGGLKVRERERGKRDRGWKRGGGVGIRTGQTRVPTARVRDKRVTSGPFTQNAFVRSDILISMPTRGTEQRRRCKRSIGIHRHSVKSLSRVPFKAARRFALFSIHSGIYRAHESHRKNQEKITVKECEILRNSRSSSKRERVWKIYCLPMKPTRVSFHFVRGFRYFLQKKKKIYISIYGCTAVYARTQFLNFARTISGK